MLVLQQASKPKKPRNREIGEVKGLSMGGGFVQVRMVGVSQMPKP